MIIANVAVSAIKVAGIGSVPQYYHRDEIHGCGNLIGIICSFKRFKDKHIRLHQITGITICTGIFEYTFHGAPSFRGRYIRLP